MATYANELFETYISDKKVKEAVLLQNLCPGNLHPVRKMDDFLDDLLKDKNKADLEGVLNNKRFVYSMRTCRQGYAGMEKIDMSKSMNKNKQQLVRKLHEKP